MEILPEEYLLSVTSLTLYQLAGCHFLKLEMSTCTNERFLGRGGWSRAHVPLCEENEGRV